MAVRYRSGEQWQSDIGEAVRGSQIQERKVVAVRYRSGERWQSDTGEESGQAVRYLSLIHI